MHLEDGIELQKDLGNKGVVLSVLKKSAGLHFFFTFVGLQVLML